MDADLGSWPGNPATNPTRSPAAGLIFPVQIRRSTKAMTFLVLAYVFGMSAAYLLFLQMPQGSSGRSNGIDWTLVVVAVVLGIVARCLKTWSRLEEQEAQDSEANNLLRDLRRHKHRPFILYLRPFSLDFGMLQPDSSYSPAPISPAHWLHSESEQFEEQLNDVGEKHGMSLVSLGNRYLTVGAARLETTDKDWFALFALLAGTARLILLIPATSEGSLREIFWLQDNALLAKTAFIQPPAGCDWEGIKAAWLQSQSALSRHGLNLPDFDDAGRVILFGQAGANPQCVSLRGNARRKLGRVVREALAAQAVTLWPADYPYETERDALETLIAARWRCSKCGEGNAGSQNQCLFCHAPRVPRKL